MKAVILKKFGEDDLEKIFEYREDFPEPKIGPTEVLIKVKAVALNHLDIWIRKGALAFKPSLPHILGSDVSGVVAKVGSAVKNIKEGDEVVVIPNISCGYCYFCQNGEDNHCKEFKILGFQIHGGYAEYVKVPAINILKKPKNLSFIESASIPLTYITAWNCLFDKGEIFPNAKVFIWGGASGMGVALIQLAKLSGAEVIATTSQEWKAKKLKEELGVDWVINHSKENIEDKVRKLFPEGVDVVIDFIGEKTFPTSIKLLKKGGRLIFLGTTTGSKGEFDLRYAFVNEISLKGVYMGRRASLFKILELFEEGKLKPIIDKVFSLKEIPQAHKYLEAGKHFGKIVIKIDED
jgi:NADPH:quinone reductase-like Zn-dependent oxidoreductase